MLTPKPFNTKNFFAGGGGIFLEYHDIVKPVYFNAVIKLIVTNSSYGLPIDIISSMSVFSLIEWYIKRRNRNPLYSLDFQHILDHNKLDELLQTILENDPSIYSLAPPLNIKRLLSNYNNQHMTFPIYVYTETFEKHIPNDLKTTFPDIPVKYLYGDINKAINKCDNNFTYIFSNIELLKIAIKPLEGKCSHILLAKEYMYNYKDNYKTLKYDLKKLLESNHFLRLGLTSSLDLSKLFIASLELINGRTVDDTN